MSDITVAQDLWSSSIMPEGFIERWLVSNGALVVPGEPVAQVRIEDALHDLMAPIAGKLLIEARVNSVVEPGSVIGRIVAHS
jgi:pyruvate/2-oxoglutarate dehydrogenase complex dihydrolipoamide acyltransferase (E2) component